jgi:rhodanese-related sulfurtransferase
VSETVEPGEARRLIAAGEAKAVDVRGEDEWRDARIPGAIRLEDEDLDAQVAEIAAEVRLIVVGEDERAREVAEALESRGREAALLDGGVEAWRKEDYPVQPSDDPDEDVTI